MNLFSPLARVIALCFHWRCFIAPPRPTPPPSTPQLQLEVLEKILLALSIPPPAPLILADILHEIHDIDRDVDRIKSLLENQREFQILVLAALAGIGTTLDEIAADLAPEPVNRTTTASIQFGGFPMATPGTLAVGSTLTATFQPLLADGTTVNTTTTLSTQPTWASLDTTVASVTANADGTATVTGVGAGTATITATGGSFTDSDSTVVGPLDASNTVSDTAPAQRTVSAQISFA